MGVDILGDRSAHKISPSSFSIIAATTITSFFILALPNHFSVIIIPFLNWKLEAKQYFTFISLVSYEMGVALLPSSIKFFDKKEIGILPLKNNISNLNISAAWNKNNKSSALQVFLQLIS
ncbi:LysR substrate-binding domain-containing protein [Neobacillus cucumis]|nr:LysR substrate-binding domain-containing protein [Neobacillus cucumis]